MVVQDILNQPDLLADLTALSADEQYNWLASPSEGKFVVYAGKGIAPHLILRKLGLYKVHCDCEYKSVMKSKDPYSFYFKTNIHGYDVEFIDHEGYQGLLIYDAENG